MSDKMKRRLSYEEWLRSRYLPIGGGQVAAPPRGGRGVPSGAPPAVGAVPFTGAAHEHIEPITSQVVTPGAAAVAAGPFDVPAYGYLRHILFQVSAAGGTLGAGVLHPDYPFNIFNSLSLLDVNGAPIFGPLDGFAALQANIYGGYGSRSDPRTSADYVGTINANFMLRIPVEIARHSGLGSLANQNAAAAYKLNWTVNPSTQLYTTAPTTIPAFTIRAHLESWSLPNEVDLSGRPQAQVPPAHGTTQYWSQFVRVTAVGNQTIILPRVGNMIRLLIAICRNTAANTPRDDTVFPDPFQIAWDARQLTNETQGVRRHRMSEALENGSTRDAGVFALIFDNLIGGKVGDEEPNLWIPTVQSTRLEVDGVSATAGSIQFLTCDIAPVEVLPAERYVETSQSGRLGAPSLVASRR